MDIAATVNTAWATPAYDRNGNMNSIPAPALLADACPARFDAWNRLVTFDNTATSVATIYGYDGLHRRAFSDVAGTFRYFIYSDQWQVLEEYAGEINRRYVWGLRYVDDLVLRDRTNIEILVERMYVLQDANWNVVAIFNPAAGEGGVGAVYERYAYTAYGVCQILGPSFAPLPSSYYDWTVLFTGRVLDDESGLYYYRMRYYHPALGVFTGRDPLELDHVASPYEYTRGTPTSHTDPSGLNCTLSAPPFVSYGRTTSSATAGGLALGAGLDPGPIKAQPATKLHCTRKRTVTALYDCCCGWWIWNTNFTTTFSFVQEQSRDISNASGVFIVGVRLALIPIKQSLPGAGIWWYQIMASDQKMADRDCTAGWGKWPRFAPPGAVPCP